MFKPRSAATPPQPPSIEQVRQRAKHRLIGVAVLVLAAVVVLPLLFDSQPRPIPVDVAIEIPSRQVVKPLVVAPPVADEAPASSVSAPKNAASTPAAVAGDSTAKEEVILPSKPTAAPQPVAKASGSDAAATVAVAKPAVSAPPAKPVVSAAKPAESPPPRANDDRAAEAARAQALLEGKPSPSPSGAPADATPRFIVQVGAFADPALAQQTRQKLERAGLKTYTHVAQTADGKRIRVRLGPFAKRADAEKAAAKAKSLGTAAAILTL